MVHRGVIYITTGAGDAVAVDVDTGSILWRYEAKLDEQRVRASCGGVNRGVAQRRMVRPESHASVSRHADS